MKMISFNPLILRMRSLADLSHLGDVRLSGGGGELRRSYKLAVLDDNPSETQTSLAQRGYDASIFHNFDDVGNVAAFSISICDILGVSPSSRLDGVFAMKEIRRTHPFSYIICHTGLSVNDKKYAEAILTADYVLRKSADISDITDALDYAIRCMSSPILYWRRVRDHLLNADVSPREIAALEHFWVKSIIFGKKKIFEDGLSRIRTGPVRELKPVLRESALVALEIGIKVASGLV